MGCYYTSGDGKFLRVFAHSSHLSRFIGQLPFLEGCVQWHECNNSVLLVLEHHAADVFVGLRATLHKVH